MRSDRSGDKLNTDGSGLTDPSEGIKSIRSGTVHAITIPWSASYYAIQLMVVAALAAPTKAGLLHWTGSEGERPAPAGGGGGRGGGGSADTVDRAACLGWFVVGCSMVAAAPADGIVPP